MQSLSNAANVSHAAAIIQTGNAQAFYNDGPEVLDTMNNAGKSWHDAGREKVPTGIPISPIIVMRCAPNLSTIRPAGTPASAATSGA